MKIEIIHSRDPDSECEITVFVDGLEWSDDVTIESIDPGAGFDGMKAEWDQHTRDLTGSPAFVEKVREIRNEVYENSEYITDQY